MSGGSASFGEMLLLFAIYFHTNQNALIAQLVSSSLGIQVTFAS
jgi:integrator complex subunit 2